MKVNIRKISVPLPKVAEKIWLAFSAGTVRKAKIVAMLGQYILEKGRPRKLHVRNQSFKYLLADLCQKLSVGLEAEQGMPAVDGFVESIAGYLARGSR